MKLLPAHWPPTTFRTRPILTACLSALALFATLRPADAVVAVENLRCEYLTNPLAIDELKPRLSWIVTSPDRGEKQTAWQVIVASTEEALAADQGDLWDSGKTATDITNQIPYNGTALTSRSTCFWKVRAWNKDDVASAWSQPGHWTIGLKSAADWTAKWIDGAPFAAPAEGMTPPTIVSAFYEATTNTNNSLNVTAKFNALAATGSFEIAVNNTTMGGDPAFNTVKRLRVVYQRDGRTLTQTFPEAAVFTYPIDLPGLPVVTSARYENTAGTLFNDVTTQFTSRTEASYTIAVNTTTFGPDPAPSETKRLRVEYMLNGKTGVRTFVDNSTFSYPVALPEVVNATMISAIYAAVDGTGTQVNVLPRINTLAAPGSFTATVNNATLSPTTDPAPNKKKRLTLTYTLDGVSEVKLLEEGVVLKYPADLAVPSTVPYLRKPFTLTKTVKKATIHATSLGIYELALNGQKVGDEFLAPGWTDYAKRVLYQTYDVTSQLVAGDNVIGGQVANGWYSGHIGNGGNQYWGVRPALRMQLEITYTDGTTDRIISDESWKMRSSPILYTDFMMGEIYDARREIPGWATPGLDDSTWAAARLRPDPAKELNGTVMEPVREFMQIKPKTLTQPAAGKWTYNMGQNMVGVIRLKLNAPAGTKLVLRHGERLNTGASGSDNTTVGTVYTANLRGAPSIDTYTCKGGGEEIWQPKFTFHGFQYVELTGLPTPPTLDTITGIVFNSDTPLAGEFTSSDGKINQLQSNIEWGQRGNYLSVPTDCPQRDERLGWLGDAQVFVKTATFNADIAAFYTKWMRDVTDSQLATGAYTDVAPYAGPSIGTPGWGDAGVICPWTIYNAYGDIRILEKNYAAMARWVDYCKNNSTNNLRTNRSGDYGDWLEIGAATNKDAIGTAYWAYSTRLVAKSAAILGNTADATKYEALFQTIKNAFNTAYVNQTTGLITGDTQAIYAMALHFELLPENLRPLSAQLLANKVSANGNRLSTGFLGVSYLLPALTKAGRSDVAYTLLQQEAYPSWLFSVNQGATTIWERWDGYTPTAGFQSTIMNSFNHYSLGSCGEWLFNSVAGIDLDPTVPAFKKIVIKPKLGGTLTSARGSYRSIHGRIATSWRKFDNRFVLDTTIPANTTATVYVPATSAEAVMESGKPIAEAIGVTYLRMEDGAAVFAVESGRYRFTTGDGAETGTDLVSRDPEATVKIRISTLLGNDGATTFLAADATTLNGATITIVDGWILYTPRPGVTGADSFNYTVKTATGGIITQTVQVGIIPEDAPVQYTLTFEAREDGSRRVAFAGVPGRIYRIQSSETMANSEAWETRLTVQADEDGTFEFIDVAPLPAARFYRAIHP